jgi:hypothetical protein
MGDSYQLHKGEATLSDLADGAAVYGYPGDEYPGRFYYVDNISGSSSNEGVRVGRCVRTALSGYYSLGGLPSCTS